MLKISNSQDGSVRYIRSYDAIQFFKSDSVFTDDYKVYIHILSGNETNVMSKSYKLKDDAEAALNKLKSDYEKFCLSCDENNIYTLTL